VGNLGTANATFLQGSNEDLVSQAEANLKSELRNGLSNRLCWIVPDEIFVSPVDWSQLVNVVFEKPDTDFTFAMWGVVLGCVIALFTLVSVAFVFRRQVPSQVQKMISGKDSFSKVDDKDSDDELREASEELDRSGVALI